MRWTLSRAVGSAVALLVLAFLVHTTMRAVAIRQYNLTAQRINLKIAALESQRPPMFSPKLWQCGVAWASIAFCNICFSESHTRYEEMHRFEQEIDEKLMQEIDLTFFDWVWTRLATTGPQGEQYFARFHSRWEECKQAEASGPEQNDLK